MLDLIEQLAVRLNVDANILILGGIGLGAIFAVFGVSQVIFDRNPAADRIASGNPNRRAARRDRALLKDNVVTPKGILKTFLPVDQEEQNALRNSLAQAGFNNSSALMIYMFVRVGLGIVLPAALLAAVVGAKLPGVNLPFGLSDWVVGFTNMQIFQGISVLVGIGYYFPAMWLSGRVKERQLVISEAFPNALDLLQVSVEAGMGFDAAMTRVGNEMAATAPELAFEFLSVQHQVQAGRPRELALADMAKRTGVEAVRSFANVVGQSMQFGTPMAEALTTYASEMRKYRELKAQEMANKLPVKMSAVLSLLMLPALILVTIGPVVIRYIRYFAAT